MDQRWIYGLPAVSKVWGSPPQLVNIKEAPESLLSLFSPKDHKEAQPIKNQTVKYGNLVGFMGFR